MDYRVNGGIAYLLKVHVDQGHHPAETIALLLRKMIVERRKTRDVLQTRRKTGRCQGVETARGWIRIVARTAKSATAS